MRLLIILFFLGVLLEANAQWSETENNYTEGKVGIGTASEPLFDLDISRSTNPYIRIQNVTYTIDPSSLVTKGGIIFNQQNKDKTAAILFAIPPGYHVPGILFSTKTAWNSPGSGATDWFDRMFVHPNGNVGIGTTTPDAKLTVKGTVHSEEVRVDLSVPGPDYVFEETYQLPSLTEVARYIQQHKHLPEIPSAKEMEENGVQLGEMNMMLLRKIEELTLYVIEQNKIIEKLQEERDSSPDISGKKIEELTLYVIELKEESQKQQKIIEEQQKQIDTIQNK